MNTILNNKRGSSCFTPVVVMSAIIDNDLISRGYRAIEIFGNFPDIIGNHTVGKRIFAIAWVIISPTVGIYLQILGIRISFSG